MQKSDRWFVQFQDSWFWQKIAWHVWISLIQAIISSSMKITFIIFNNNKKKSSRVQLPVNLLTFFLCLPSYTHLQWSHIDICVKKLSPQRDGKIDIKKTALKRIMRERRRALRLNEKIISSEWDSEEKKAKERERDGLDGLLMGLLLIISFHLLLSLSLSFFFFLSPPSYSRRVLGRAASSLRSTAARRMMCGGRLERIASAAVVSEMKNEIPSLSLSIIIPSHFFPPSLWCSDSSRQDRNNATAQ